MGRREWRLAGLLALTCALAGLCGERSTAAGARESAPGDRTSLKEDMRFAAEAARQGLWREALFRWERQLKAHPDNARIHNNIGVACEGLGDYARALRAYGEARRLDAESKEIRANHEALRELCRIVKVCPEDAPAGGPSGDEPVPAPPAATGGDPA
jgi:tetratricopeptide (TPR) repeat protein